jgi:hypothetical protein
MATRGGISRFCAVLLGAAAAGALGGCGGPGGGTSQLNQGGPAGAGPAGGISPAGVAWIVNGGDAVSGRAAGGGSIHVIARGAVTVGASPAPPPPLPAPPADSIAVDGTALANDLTAAGPIRIDGRVDVTGGASIRQITSISGDIFVAGALRGRGAGLALRAPNGCVYVLGSVDTSGVAAGHAGGALIIAARRVVVIGSLAANGADGVSGGGAAGAITISATDLVFVGGPLALRGGGGTAGAGAGGVLTIDTPGAVQSSSRIDARGGAARGSGATAGAGGAIKIGERAAPLLVNVSVPLSARGGAGGVVGGAGGAVTLELGRAVDLFNDENDRFGGHLLIDTAGLIDASGGAGTIGGSARSNGADGVASFPDAIEQIAVLINGDGIPGMTDNWLVNDGLIVARGGTANGNGGDIVYRGTSPDRDSRPPPGNIDNAGNGTGKPGDYAGE